MNSSIDTNIILRYILNDVPEQAKKVEKLLKDTTQTLYVPDMVVAEVIFNLQLKDFSRDSIVGILNGLNELPNIKMSELIKEVLPYFAEHPALSFVDCYAAMEAEKKGREPLWTFDRKLANQCPSAKRL